MIALLTGKIAYKSPEFIVIDVSGVGYRVQIPLSTYYDLPEEGKDLSLHIHTQVKEDGINLFGFRSLPEKHLFQLLISVSGIGPKLGKDILSNIQVNDLAVALSSGDLTRLSAIPGIGTKTSERLVLELKSKVLKLNLSPASGDTPVSTSSAITDDVTSALVNLGYKETLVKKALSELEIPEGASMEDLLKRALKRLMK